MGEPPQDDASASEIAAFIFDARSAGLAAVVLLALAVPLFAIFAGAIRDSISGSVGSGLAGAGVGGGVLFMLLTALGISTVFGLARIDGVVETMTADISAAAWNVGNVMIAIGAPLGVLFLGVVAFAGLRGAMAKWQSWAALVVAVMLLVGSFQPVAGGVGPFLFFGSMLFALWILATSIQMLMNKGE
jgi:hypothetical protein